MESLFFETKKPLTLTLNSELRQQLNKVVQVTIADPSIRNKILLCASEAITNLLQHSQKKASELTLRFGHNNQGWLLDILDDGHSWDPTKHNEVDLLSSFELDESGRGISLLHSQCDQMQYNTNSDTKINQLRLIWKKSTQEHRPTVLLVEDDDSMRLIYKHYLDDFNVLSAANGHKALRLLKENKVDLVLSDINMPEMTGLELREELNKKSGSDIIPFIFLTAFNDTQMQKRANQLGIDDYLIKPIEKNKLTQTINRVLERSRQIYQQLTDRIEKSITSALIPELPIKSHGWKLCVANRNTGSGGGDLLLYKSNEKNIQIVVTDIMGHDDSAKFFAHACSGYLHGLLQSHKNNGDSASLLEHLSDFALEDKLLSKVILTCCSVILSQDGKINISSAGHPAPLRINESGIETLQVGGMLPGLLPNTTYQPKILEIGVGERIAIFTDGLFESAADEEHRTQLEESISLALVNTLSEPIDKALNSVMQVFDDFTQGKATDDVLLLLFERDE